MGMSALNGPPVLPAGLAVRSLMPRVGTLRLAGCGSCLGSGKKSVCKQAACACAIRQPGARNSHQLCCCSEQPSTHLWVLNTGRFQRQSLALKC